MENKNLESNQCPNNATAHVCFYLRGIHWEQVCLSFNLRTSHPHVLECIQVIQMTYELMLKGDLFRHETKWSIKSGIGNWDAFHGIHNSINFVWVAEYLKEEYDMQLAYERMGSPEMDIL